MKDHLNFEDVLCEITEIKQEKGYVYAYPPKRSWVGIEQPNQFVIDSWNGGNYTGDLGIYLHVPFCPPRRPPKKIKNILSDQNLKIDGGASTLCGFCNLYAMVGIEGTDVVANFVDALVAEIQLAIKTRLVSKPKISSIYFGGGTPSVLKPEQFARIIEALVEFSGEIPKNAEFALEASPDSFSLGGGDEVDVERLKKLVKLGFNRISLGIQSFDDAEMDYIGRPYGGLLNERVLAGAIEAGFRNINGDLILGLPLQTEKSFLASLHKMIEIGPPTITVYQHLIRKGTRFGQEKDLGLLEDQTNKFIADNYIHAKNILEKNGYVQESLNRWAIPSIGGYKQQENEFNLVPSIGFGPSARSYALSGHYSSDYAVNSKLVKKSTKTWAHSINNNLFPATTGFKLNTDESKRRHIIFKLMTDEGIIESQYIDSFGQSFYDEFGCQFQALINKELVINSGSGGLRFSPKGFQYSSPIAEHLFFSELIRHRENNYSVV